MNSSMIRYVLGSVLKIEAALLLLPALVGLIYREPQARFYLYTAFGAAAIGFLITIIKPKDFVIYLKEGCLSTALSWILMSVFGALPFYFSGEIPSYTDALFETISGFTTTGASILSDVEALCHCNLLWRSFTHWVGGMGVLVFLMAIIPMSGGSNINLMRAESPGPSVGKLVPKMKSTAQILYLIYFALTLIEFILLLFGKMPIFDAICMSFGTAGTGGFGVLNSSAASYSTYCQWILTIFMILFGVNFNAYFILLFQGIKEAFNIEEVKVYFCIIIAAIAILMVDVVKITGHVFEGLTHSAFQVASIITTTGFSTMDFNEWSQTSRTVLVILMFIGACAGSTGGGIKVSRFMILIRTVFKELGTYLHPHSVKKIQLEGKPVEHEVVRSVNVFFITFITLFTTSVFLLSFEGHDLETNFTAVAATINNIGPGLNLVGPSCNFGFFSDFSKYVLMFDMLAGRLELFPMLILFIPDIWEELLTMHKPVKNPKKKQSAKAQVPNK